MRTLGILLLSLLLPSCDLAEEAPPTYEEVAGSYRAVVFTEPGSHDGGVDLLAAGGSLTARLQADGSLSGRIVIPPEIGSNYAPVDTTFAGRYVLAEHTLWFEGTEPAGVLPFEEAQWKADQQEIETFDVPGRGSAFKIVLQRK